MEPSLDAMLEELARASSALSRATAVAVDPYRFLVGALLDMTSNLEDFITDHPLGNDGDE